MGTSEVGSHTHTVSFQAGTEPGNNRLTGGGTILQTTTANQADASVQAMNVVQRCFVSLLWVRIK